LEPPPALWPPPVAGLTPAVGPAAHPTIAVDTPSSAALPGVDPSSHLPPASAHRSWILMAMALVALGCGFVLFYQWYLRMQVFQNIVQVEQRWNDASIRGDRSALADILSDNYHHEYKGMLGRAHVLNKTQVIAATEASPGIKRWELSDTQLVDWSGTRARLSGTVTLFGDGFEKRATFTDTFELTDGKWRAIDSDRSYNAINSPRFLPPK